MCTQGMLWYAAILAVPPSSLTCPRWRREGIHRTRRCVCVCVLCVIVDVRMCVVWVCTCIHAPVAQACIYDDTPNCYLGGRIAPISFLSNNVSPAGDVHGSLCYSFYAYVFHLSPSRRGYVSSVAQRTRLTLWLRRFQQNRTLHTWSHQPQWLGVGQGAEPAWRSLSSSSALTSLAACVSQQRWVDWLS